MVQIEIPTTPLHPQNPNNPIGNWILIELQGEIETDGKLDGKLLGKLEFNPKTVSLHLYSLLFFFKTNISLFNSITFKRFSQTQM